MFASKKIKNSHPSFPMIKKLNLQFLFRDTLVYRWVEYFGINPFQILRVKSLKISCDLKSRFEKITDSLAIARNILKYLTCFPWLLGSQQMKKILEIWKMPQGLKLWTFSSTEGFRSEYSHSVSIWTWLINELPWVGRKCVDWNENSTGQFVSIIYSAMNRENHLHLMQCSSYSLN